jgi:hypothetical protein
MSRANSKKLYDSDPDIVELHKKATKIGSDSGLLTAGPRLWGTLQTVVKE